VQGKTLGTLGIIDPEPGAFDEAETKLLRELADNEACARILGYPSRQELLACPVSQLYETPQESSKVLAQLIRDGQLLDHERRLRRKGHRRRDRAPGRSRAGYGLPAQAVHS